MPSHTMRFATLDDIGFIDDIIALPDVTKRISTHDKVVSIGGLIGDHIFCVCEGGFVYAEPLGSGDFGCVCAFKPEYRGIYSVMAIRESIRLVFSETECERMLGTAFVGDKDISRLWKSVGFHKIADCDTRIVGTLSYLKWALNDREMGYLAKEFCKQQSKGVLGNTWANAFGAFLLAIAHGNIIKGVHQLNLYCVGAGRKLIEIEFGHELRFNFHGIEFSEQDVISFVMDK